MIKFFAAILLSYFMTDVSASDTLNKIKKSGTINLGVRDISIPFSYLDNKQQYIGYSVDLCMKAVDGIKSELELSALKVKFIPVTSATRVPLTANGTVDLYCGSAIRTPEREKQVDFSVTTFVTGIGFLSKKSSNIKAWKDLNGKTVAATSGTVIFHYIAKINKESQLGIKVIPTKDHGEAFHMVETGRATAFVMDDAFLAAMRANSKSPEDYAISTDSSSQPYGLIMRRHDPKFKKVVNQALSNLYQSGEINRIYAKWFQSPIPPRGINLNWPMSEPLKKIIKNPDQNQR